MVKSQIVEKMCKKYQLCKSDQQVKFHSEKLARDDDEAMRRQRVASQRGYTDPRPFSETTATEVFESFAHDLLEDLDNAFEGNNFRKLGAALLKLQDFRRQGIVEKRDKLGRLTIKVFSDEQIKTMEAIDTIAVKWMNRWSEKNLASMSSSSSQHMPEDILSCEETDALG